MRSRLTLSDTMTGLLISIMLVAAAAWVLEVLHTHAEKHGHDVPAPLFQTEPVHGGDDGAGRKAQHGGGGGGHAYFFATGSVSDAVRRCRNDSDSAQ
jgi:hypothetical protein